MKPDTPVTKLWYLKECLIMRSANQCLPIWHAQYLQLRHKTFRSIHLCTFTLWSSAEQPPSYTHLILVCPPRSHTWNFRLLYVTVSTLKPIAVQKKNKKRTGTVSLIITTVSSVHSVIFLLTTAILFSILRLYNVREIVGEKMTLNLRLCRDWIWRKNWHNTDYL